MKVKEEKKMAKVAKYTASPWPFIYAWEASQEEYDRAQTLVDDIQTSLVNFLSRRSTREHLIWSLINLRRPDGHLRIFSEEPLPNKRNTKKRDRSKLLFLFRELVTELFEEQYGKEGIDDR